MTLNERDLFRALGDIDPELLPPMKPPARVSFPWKHYLGTAVAACFFFIVIPLVLMELFPQVYSYAGTVSSPGVSQTGAQYSGLTQDGPDAGAGLVQTPPEGSFIFGWDGKHYDSRDGILFSPGQAVSLAISDTAMEKILELIAELPEPEAVSDLNEPKYILITSRGAYSYEPGGDAALLEACSYIAGILSN